MSSVILLQIDIDIRISYGEQLPILQKPLEQSCLSLKDLEFRR